MTDVLNTNNNIGGNACTDVGVSFSVYLLTLGCDKNRVDGEVMLGRLVSTQIFTPITDPAAADIIIVNTCGFIREATQESIDTILEMSTYRSDPTAPCRALVVVGCMSERYREETKAEIPEADAVLGVKDADNIVDVVSGLLGINAPDTTSDIGANRVASSPYVHNRHVAHIKISDGCDNACAYCTIPSIRGPYVSRPFEDIVNECKLLISAGAKELVLVAQDTALYGIDLYGTPRLHELIRAIAGLDGDTTDSPGVLVETAALKPWIRLMYAYSEHITPEIIQAIADLPNVCKYIDMPIQHSETSVLKRMGRHGTTNDLRELIRNLRDKIPGIALRTTLMVGFPGETVENFRALYNFVKEVQFDRLGVFPYSREEGTKAATMPQQVKDSVKHSRRDRLMRLQQKIHHDKQQAKIGHTVDVMVDEASQDSDITYTGRTQHDAYEVDAIVRFTSAIDRQLNAGDIVKVIITDADEYDLMGVQTQI